MFTNISVAVFGLIHSYVPRMRSVIFTLQIQAMVTSLHTFVYHIMPIKEDRYSRERKLPSLDLGLDKGMFMKQQKSKGRRVGLAWQLGSLVSLFCGAPACPGTQGEPWSVPILCFLNLKMSGWNCIPFIPAKPWNAASRA